MYKVGHDGGSGTFWHAALPHTTLAPSRSAGSPQHVSCVPSSQGVSLETDRVALPQGLVRHRRWLPAAVARGYPSICKGQRPREGRRRVATAEAGSNRAHWTAGRALAHARLSQLLYDHGHPAPVGHGVWYALAGVLADDPNDLRRAEDGHVARRLWLVRRD
eukprot:scaffold95643_cov58-Phaeocystis_antarctica.AAC.5